MSPRQIMKFEDVRGWALALRWLLLLALCSAYLLGGIVKLLDFPSAMAEMANFKLPLPAIMAVAVIVTELGASALVLCGRLRWLGALWLAGFTVAAALVANRFWQLPMPDRGLAANAFFEHMGLAAAFLLVAWTDFNAAQCRLQRDPPS